MAEINFELPASLIFGNKEVLRLGSEAAKWGERALIICDSIHKNNGTLDIIRETLEKSKLKVLEYSEVTLKATTFAIEEVLHLARTSHSQVIIGVGGVKTLSFAKSVASLARTKNHVDDLFAHNLKPMEVIPLILVPTSIRDPFLLSEKCFITESRNRSSAVCSLFKGITKQIIIDPTLTVSLPYKYTLLALMEILLTSIEAYCSNQSSFLVETLTVDTIQKVTRAILSLSESKDDLMSKKRACEAALCHSMALSITGVLPGLALSYVTASYFNIPKSSVSNILYPYIFDSKLYNDSEKMNEISILLKKTLQWDNLSENDNLSSVLRSMIGKFNLPVRLGNLKINGDELSICSDVTETVLSRNNGSISSDSLFEILRDAL